MFITNSYCNSFCSYLGWLVIHLLWIRVNLRSLHTAAVFLAHREYSAVIGHCSYAGLSCKLYTLLSAPAPVPRLQHIPAIPYTMGTLQPHHYNTRTSPLPHQHYSASKPSRYYHNYHTTTTSSHHHCTTGTPYPIIPLLHHHITVTPPHNCHTTTQQSH